MWNRRKKMINLFGIQFRNLNGESVVRSVAESQELQASIHLIAVSTLVESKKNRDLALLINKGIAVCDSKILENVLKVFFPKFMRIRGVDFLRNFIAVDGSRNRHFLLGGENATLEQMVKNMKIQNPTINISGIYSPPFAESIDMKKCADVIKETDANVIWVSLGSPKQDYVASYLSDTLKTRTIAIGAAFDFYSDRKKEAPLRWQNSGFEWLFRFISEPKRLWRRYLLGNSYFLIHLPFEIMKNFK